MRCERQPLALSEPRWPSDSQNMRCVCQGEFESPLAPNHTQKELLTLTEMTSSLFPIHLTFHMIPFLSHRRLLLCVCYSNVFFVLVALWVLRKRLKATVRSSRR